MNQETKNKLKPTERIRYAVKRSKGIAIETDLSQYNKTLERILDYDLGHQADDLIACRVRELRESFQTGSSLDELLPEMFAIVREMVKRVLGIEPFHVQLLAGIAMHQGKLAEMHTGEGKTLAAIFPASLNSLTGKGIHILTANDYLAKRDALWMGDVYRVLGITTGYVQERTDPQDKVRAYRADITYLTAKQAGFDFLYDGIQFEAERSVQRPFAMCIVDEADFILVDEARIPLVIAKESGSAGINPVEIDACVRKLERDHDYQVERLQRRCHVTLEGEKRVQHLLGCDGMHTEDGFQIFAAVHVALHAHHLLALDVDYVIKDGIIELVDEFTGRIADKRKWPYGIQRALEAKEHLTIQREGMVCGSITVQHFINLYPKIAAMTATAEPAAMELKTFYGLNTVIIPPNLPKRMEHLSDHIYRTYQAKLSALIDEIITTQKTGRPVLVGTRSVKESDELSNLLTDRGVAHQVLNAKNDEREAAMVEKAGMLGAVTISTNMAGRGTDIQLGGPRGVSRKRIKDLGGLYVIGTNKHESVRIDNQLRGRAGRQGDPGSSCFFISLEDDLITRYAITEFIPECFLSSADPSPIQDRTVAKEIVRAQEIIENQHYEMRKTLRRYTELIEKQRRTIFEIRRDALENGVFSREVLELCQGRYDEVAKLVGDEIALSILKGVFIQAVDEFWSSHLAWVDEIREGIHLRRLGKQDPLLAFIKDATETFSQGMGKIDETTADNFLSIDVSKESLDSARRLLNTPTSTWTYMINDNPFPLFRVALLGSDIATGAAVAVQTAVLAPLLLIIGILRAAIRGFSRLKLRAGEQNNTRDSNSGR